MTSVEGSTSGNRSSGGRAALLAAARAELNQHGADGVSLRAVARHAGLSHAAPKNHFGDRAGLLTAVAVDGFRRFGEALQAATGSSAPTVTDMNPSEHITVLGRAYVEFGLANPALFDLMFRKEQLDVDNAELCEARERTFGSLLSSITSAVADQQYGNNQDPMSLSLVAWAFVHGLVALMQTGALESVSETATDDVIELALSLPAVFTDSLLAADGA